MGYAYKVTGLPMRFSCIISFVSFFLSFRSFPLHAFSLCLAFPTVLLLSSIPLPLCSSASRSPPWTPSTPQYLHSWFPGHFTHILSPGYTSEARIHIWEIIYHYDPGLPHLMWHFPTLSFFLPIFLFYFLCSWIKFSAVYVHFCYTSTCWLTSKQILFFAIVDRAVLKIDVKHHYHRM